MRIIIDSKPMKAFALRFAVSTAVVLGALVIVPSEEAGITLGDAISHFPLIAVLYAAGVLAVSAWHGWIHVARS